MLGLTTLALYAPSLRHDFIQYDDQQYVTENLQVQAGLTIHGLIWAFGCHASNWHPLTWLFHMLDCQFYGLNAAGHHLTNLLLHVCNTLVLFLVLSRMTGATWRSAFVAALFAWHPLHVESVAWVAERKDVLSALFWMLTLGSYLWYVTQPKPSRYTITLICFALGLMSKPMVVTLPFVLLLLDYWPLGRISKFSPQAAAATETGTQIRPLPWNRVLLEKCPFLVLSAAGCILTLSAQGQAESIVSTAGLPPAQRIVHAVISYGHYLFAAFVPRHLAVYYPYETGVPFVELAGVTLTILIITFFCLRQTRLQPYLLVGWLWYLGTLVPVIGLVQVGDQAWADRYTYIPLIGLFIMVVWRVAELPFPKAVFCALGMVILAASASMTAVQLGYWRTTRTLFEHAARVTHNNYMAITMLGSLLAQEGKMNEAIAHYHTALRLKPTFPEAHFFLANALDEEGNLDAAIAEYRKALWFRPIAAQTRIFMGMALAKQKKYDEAVVQYNAALKLDPDSAIAQNNLARILHTQGQFNAAIEHYKAALNLNPKLAIAHNNLGILLLQQGRLASGTRQLREALKLKPDNAETQFNLALALNQQAQWSEAAGLFRETLDGHANDPKAHYEFAVALAHLKKPREAMSQYAAALLIQPDFPAALDGLAWILSTDANPDFRNGDEAVKMSRRACELTGNQDADKLKTLAAAYAETGRFGDAMDTLREASDLAAKAHRQETVSECSWMLESFQRSEKWRSY